jgi:hypothetical protein
MKAMFMRWIIDGDEFAAKDTVSLISVKQAGPNVAARPVRNAKPLVSAYATRSDST